MSDRDLRVLERAYKTSGMDVDHGRLLTARMRAGELDQRMVELAAYLGHKGARAAVAGGGNPPETTGNGVLMLTSAEWSTAGDTARWLSTFAGKLSKFGEEAAMRGCIAIAHVGVRRLEIERLIRRGFELTTTGEDGTVESVPLSVLTYGGRRRFLDADEMHERRALDAQETWLLNRDSWAKADAALRRLTIHVPKWCSLAPVINPEVKIEGCVASFFITWPDPEVQSQRAHLTGRMDDAEARKEIREELIPWALGEGDPVASRWLGRSRCHAARDGECFWSDCPQLRDGEPARSGRHCPIDHELDEDEPFDDD